MRPCLLECQKFESELENHHVRSNALVITGENRAPGLDINPSVAKRGFHFHGYGKPPPMNVIVTTLPAIIQFVAENSGVTRVKCYTTWVERSRSSEN